METIVALGKYTLIRSKGYESSSEIAVFYVKLENELQAEVTVDYENNDINTVIRDIQVSNGFSENIIGVKQLKAVPKPFAEEVVSISMNLSSSTRKVISLIKYYLRHTFISEALFSGKEIKWGNNLDCLYEFPRGGLFVSSISAFSSEPLRKNTIINIQSALNNNIEPLIAMRHLHKARAENIAHRKWIDATIAAELAVKEVLSKANPDLELLLLEMPSPPLSKLYGVILEKYLGEKSPYLKQISKGVEIRNRLVHRPHSEHINIQDANDYVSYIESAIFHLLHRLYPNEHLINNAYKYVRNDHVTIGST